MSSMDEYIKTLEKQNEELKNMVAAYNPTTENILRLAIDAKKQYIQEHSLKMIMDGVEMKRNGIVASVGIHTALREFCTIKFNIGRACGHTTALKKIFASNTIDNIIIISNRMMKRHIPEGVYVDEIKAGTTFTKKLILCDNCLREDKYVDQIYDTIYERMIQQGTPPIIVLT